MWRQCQSHLVRATDGKTTRGPLDLPIYILAYCILFSGSITDHWNMNYFNCNDGPFSQLNSRKILVSWPMRRCQPRKTRALPKLLRRKARINWLAQKPNNGFSMFFGKLNTGSPGSSASFGESARRTAFSRNLHVHVASRKLLFIPLVPTINVCGKCLFTFGRTTSGDREDINWPLPTFGHWNMTSAIEEEAAIATPRGSTCNKLFRKHKRPRLVRAKAGGWCPG